MGQATYVYRPSTGLYYPVTVQELEGELTLDVAQAGGIAAPPPYIADPGESLISVETYLIANRLTTLDMTTAQFNFFACGISDLVESYCNYSWRISEVAVPTGLQKVVANMIKVDIENSGKSQIYQSESMTGYSYSLAANILPNSILSQFAVALAPYRVLNIWM